MSERPAPRGPAPGGFALGGFALGTLFVLAAVVLFSFKGIFVKLAYAEGAGAIPLLYLRFAMALPLFWALALARFGPKRLFAVERPAALVSFLGGGLITYVAWSADFKALELIDVGLARIILFSFPVFVFVFDGIRLRRFPPPRHWLVLVVIEGGVLLALGGFDLAYFLANLEGGAWAMLAALGFAGFIMVNQHATPRIGGLRFTTFTVTGAFVALTIHFFAFHSVSNLELSGLAYLYAGLIALFCTLVPYLLFAEGLKHTGASRAALLSGIGPPAAILYAYLILGETLTPVQLVGMGLVLAGVIALEARLKRAAPEAV